MEHQADGACQARQDYCRTEERVECESDSCERHKGEFLLRNAADS